MEEALDKLRLAYHVSPVQSFHLPLSHHMQRFNAFQSPLGSMKGAETLHRSPPPSDESMILLDDVRQVLRPSQITILRQHSLLL